MMKDVNHHSKIHSAVAVLLFYSMVACAEVIDLGNEQGPSQLFVYGRFTSGLEENLIQLATTSTFNGGQNPVENARITVVSETGAREEYAHIGDGLYELFNNEIIGQTGQQYHLEITLSDGRQYKSVPATMPGKVAQDYLDFEPRPIERLVTPNGIIRRNVIDLKVRTEIFDPEEDHYMRWNLLETWRFAESVKIRQRPTDPPLVFPFWCFLETELEPQSIFIYDGSELKLEEIPWRTMTERKHDSTFSVEYHFQVIQSSLTADAFRFWKELDQMANTQGSIFDQPLGPVRSNLFNVNDPKEQVLGYFEVSYVDTTRIQVHDEDVPFRVFLPCGLWPPAPECDNCLVLEGAKKVKPYWLD